MGASCSRLPKGERVAAPLPAPAPRTSARGATMRADGSLAGSSFAQPRRTGSRTHQSSRSMETGTVGMGSTMSFPSVASSTRSGRSGKVGKFGLNSSATIATPGHVHLMASGASPTPSGASHSGHGRGGVFADAVSVFDHGGTAGTAVEEGSWQPGGIAEEVYSPGTSSDARSDMAHDGAVVVSTHGFDVTPHIAGIPTWMRVGSLPEEGSKGAYSSPQAQGHGHNVSGSFRRAISLDDQVALQRLQQRHPHSDVQVTVGLGRYALPAGYMPGATPDKSPPQHQRTHSSDASPEHQQARSVARARLRSGGSGFQDASATVRRSAAAAGAGAGAGYGASAAAAAAGTAVRGRGAFRHSFTVGPVITAPAQGAASSHVFGGPRRPSLSTSAADSRAAHARMRRGFSTTSSVSSVGDGTPKSSTSGAPPRPRPSPTKAVHAAGVTAAVTAAGIAGGDAELRRTSTATAPSTAGPRARLLSEEQRQQVRRSSAPEATRRAQGDKEDAVAPAVAATAAPGSSASAAASRRVEEERRAAKKLKKKRSSKKKRSRRHRQRESHEPVNPKPIRGAYTRSQSLPAGGPNITSATPPSPNLAMADKTLSNLVRSNSAFRPYDRSSSFSANSERDTSSPARVLTIDTSDSAAPAPLTAHALTPDAKRPRAVVATPRGESEGTGAGAGAGAGAKAVGSVRGATPSNDVGDEAGVTAARVTLSRRGDTAFTADTGSRSGSDRGSNIVVEGVVLDVGSSGRDNGDEAGSGGDTTAAATGIAGE